MHWQRALEWLIAARNSRIRLFARRRAGLLLARLTRCQRHVAQRCTTRAFAPGPIRKASATRRVGVEKKWGARAFLCGENRIGFSGPYPPLANPRGRGRRVCAQRHAHCTPWLNFLPVLRLRQSVNLPLELSTSPLSSYRIQKSNQKIPSPTVRMPFAPRRVS